MEKKGILAQTEWATDVCFDSTDSLRAIYRPLIRGAMTTLGCDDVLRFMNKRRSFQGDPDSNFRNYPEGVRVKHHLGGNTVKAYDKAGSVLRIETTISQPSPCCVTSSLCDSLSGANRIALSAGVLPVRLLPIDIWKPDFIRIASLFAW
ncbi:MAG: hypothetical protein ACYTG0_19870 [Planctomycetota bacterium]|jgi:hypothetical protein